MSQLLVAIAVWCQAPYYTGVGGAAEAKPKVQTCRDEIIKCLKHEKALTTDPGHFVNNTMDAYLGCFEKQKVTR